MKVFQDFISKLDSTEKHDRNFSNLCMKKSGSFQKERFSFLLKSSMGGGGDLTPETPSPCVRQWASTSNFACKSAFGVNFRFAVGYFAKAKITQYNIVYNILYFLVNYRISIISLLF